MLSHRSPSTARLAVLTINGFAVTPVAPLVAAQAPSATRAAGTAAAPAPEGGWPRTCRTAIALLFACSLAAGVSALAQAPLTKAVVGDRIKKVEDGVDEFRDWAEKRADTAAKSGSATRRGRTATESQKDRARDTKDELDDALSDLNRSTNRLRRKFDPLEKWMETRSQVESVLDDARKINQVMVRGKYGTQAEKYWAVLRNNINDLARAYGLTGLSA
jgi:hypothetical protein